MNLTCIIPAENIRKADLNKIVDTSNRVGVTKLILISTQDLEEDIKPYENIHYVRSKPGTKISKLKMVNNLVDDEDMVFVLDSDDLINKKFNIKNLNSDYDLILIDYYKKHLSKIWSPYFRVKFDSHNFSWNKNGTPYFGNHSLIVKGSIFKKTNYLLKNFDFQRHEDAVRSFFYLGMSRNHCIDERVDSILIMRRNWNSKSASKFEDMSITSSILSINDLLYKEKLEISSNFILRKSQISSIVEVFLTTKRLTEKGYINEDVLNNLRNKLLVLSKDYKLNLEL